MLFYFYIIFALILIISKNSLLQATPFCGTSCPTNIAGASFCMELVGGLNTCYGSNLGCLWSSGDCTVDSDCLKYDSTTSVKYQENECVINNYVGDVNSYNAVWGACACLYDPTLTMNEYIYEARSKVETNFDDQSGCGAGSCYFTQTKDSNQNNRNNNNIFGDDSFQIKDIKRRVNEHLNKMILDSKQSITNHLYQNQINEIEVLKIKDKAQKNTEKFREDMKKRNEILQLQLISNKNKQTNFLSNLLSE